MSQNPPKTNSSGTEQGNKTTKQCDFCYSEIPIKATRCRFCSSCLSNTYSEDNKGFTVLREEIPPPPDSNITVKTNRLTLVLKDDQLKQLFRAEDYNNPDLLEKEAKVTSEKAFTMMPRLREYRLSYTAQPTHPIHGLLEFLEEEYKDQRKKFEEMVAGGVISFEALQFVFTRGTEFYGFENDALLGSSVRDTRYQTTSLGTYFYVTGEVVKSNGEYFYTESHKFYVQGFSGLRKISGLPIRPMEPEVKEFLQKRGEKFNKIGVSHQYMNYIGPMFWKRTFSTSSWKADGRVMIDTNSFNRMNPEYRAFSHANAAHHNSGLFVPQKGGENITSLSPEMWYKTWPTLGAFSFTTKKWGELLVEKTSDISFDSQAFDRLVLPEETKDLITALVQHTDNTFADLISGKGAGCILILHGPPGTGKTLTAEAIAEVLQRPLYSITVGELGTETVALEKTLRDILDVCSVWEAVILMDEADIFLEKRSENDIQRNAMVGIFLRLLEYHQGVLFLTTNRVKELDEAFFSRISVGIRYSPLDKEARKQVWKNFMEMGGLSDNQLDVEKLSEIKMNGRQIRSTIRLALALAKKESVEMEMKHIDRVLGVTNLFLKDIEVGNSK